MSATQSSLRISGIPKKTLLKLNQRARKSGQTPAAYVRHLVEENLRAPTPISEIEKIDSILLAAIEEGPSTPMTDQDWENIRADGKKRAALRRRK